MAKVFKDINETINNLYKEVKGIDSEITTTGVISVGQELMSASGTNQIKLYEDVFEALLGRIAKTIYDNRAYTPIVRNMLVDKVEWGKFYRKVYIKPVEPEVNPEYISVKGNIVQKSPYDVTAMPEVFTRVFYEKGGYAYTYTVTLSQLRDAFLGEDEMDEFLSNIYNTMVNKISIDMENLGNMAVAFAIENTHSRGKKINLLTDYNTINSTTLTRDQALNSKEFLRYCVRIIKKHIALMQRATNFYTIEDFVQFSKKEDIVIEILNDFETAMEVNMQGDTFNKDTVVLSNTISIPYWQSCINGDFESASRVKIDNKTAIENVVCFVRDQNYVGTYFGRENEWTQYNPRSNNINYGFNFLSGYGVDDYCNSIVFTLN